MNGKVELGLETWYKTRGEFGQNHIVKINIYVKVGGLLSCIVVRMEYALL